MKDNGQIVYATDILSADDATGRIPRHVQSAAAAHLLEKLGGPDFARKVSSKSHSRAAIAAAASDVTGLLLGIDIEWMAPHRPFAAIASGYLGIDAAQMDAERFYRGWTFYEAYYKALQRFPPVGLVELAIAQHNEGVANRLSDGMCVLYRRMADAFQLCVVWHAAGSENLVPRYAPQADRAKA